MKPARAKPSRPAAAPKPGPAAFAALQSIRPTAAPQLGEAVADAIVNAIAQGTLEPGARIVEEVVASQLQVSRVPIREAIKILQAQGILQVLPNRGARVAAFDADVIDKVNEARIALEWIAAQGAMRTFRSDPQRAAGLQDIIAHMEAVARRADWAGLRRCDIAFHREICIASDNDIILKLWEALSRHIVIIFGREIASERKFDVVIAQHRRLLEMLLAGSPAVARELESHILRLRHKASRPPGRFLAGKSLAGNGKSPRARA